MFIDFLHNSIYTYNVNNIDQYISEIEKDLILMSLILKMFR
jgi:hypothetical protein